MEAALLQVHGWSGILCSVGKDGLPGGTLTLFLFRPVLSRMVATGHRGIFRVKFRVKLKCNEIY